MSSAANPYTQYVSTEAPQIMMISAIQKPGTDISSATFSITFHVAIHAFGSSVINNPLRFKLRSVLSSTNPLNPDLEILTDPVPKEGATYRYKLKGPGSIVTASGSVYQNTITGLEWIHGDLHFVVPKQSHQVPVMNFVEFES